MSIYLFSPGPGWLNISLRCSKSSWRSLAPANHLAWPEWSEAYPGRRVARPCGHYQAHHLACFRGGMSGKELQVRGECAAGRM